VRLGEKATEVLRRLEERPGFPGAQQYEWSGLGKPLAIGRGIDESGRS
jgi:hypothetical protein